MSLKPKPDIAWLKSTTDATVHSELGVKGIMKRAREEMIPFSRVSVGGLREKGWRESRFAFICFPSVKTPPSLKEGDDNRTKS